MKKILCLFLVLLLLSFVLSISASAESNVETTLEIAYEYNDGGNIFITAEFVDIKPEEGIIALEYDIKYDHTVVELVKAEPIYPERWLSLIDNGMVEDLSQQTGLGNYHWAFVVFSIKQGVKNDNELGIKLEFKPLKKESTKIELVYDDIITEVTENGQTIDLLHVTGNTASVDIDFEDPQNPNIDNTDVSIHENESHYTSSEVDTGSDISNTTSSTVSNNNSPDNKPITMPEIDENGFISSDSSVSENTGSDGWMVWVLIGVGVCVVVVTAVFVVKSKRGKK